MTGTTIAIIPARFASTRFPGKPLAMIGDQTMIQRVYERVTAASSVDAVIVATDDERIFEHVKSFGGKVVMTAAHHQSGTDRCAEVAAQVSGAAWIINVQGDEPFIQPAQIDLLVATLKQATGGIATLVKQITENEVLLNENVVKAVVSKSGEALYFSRSPIPFLRGVPREAWLQQQVHYKHLGLYGFKKEVLAQLSQLAPTTLELKESLEQLRWLENGFRITVGITDLETIGIDTPDDLEKCNLSLLNVL